MKKNAFTLIELVAVIVILGIILAITVPSITNAIKNSAKAAFQSDAKLVLKAIDYEKLENASFNGTTVNQSNIDELLGLSNENYESIKITSESNTLVITVIGKGKWDGFVACGTYFDMSVFTSTSECRTDLISPVITILGDNPANIYINESYIDAGATATDDKEGDITSNIIKTGNLNPTIPGAYTMTYTVTDASGNQAEAVRVVNVIDNVGPSITLSPNGNTIYAKSNTTQVSVNDPGNVNNDSLKYLWSIDITEPSSDLFISSYKDGDIINTPTMVSGSYYLWLKASDAAGNETIVRSNAFNLDNEPPIITINGSVDVSVDRGIIYSDAGAIASDNIDTNVAVTSMGSVNPNIVGTYTITYDASDSSGNVANSVTRTVTVIDVAAPVITILGDNPITIYAGGTYTDAGATATDDVDGDVTSKINITGTVNPSVVGTYTITYTVKDNAGNMATATRTVNVIDNIPPTIAASPNGNSTYAKSYSAVITVSDAHTGVNTSSLKYLWNTSVLAPTEASFTTSFANGGTITSPASVTGSYYLWILAKDNAGNTTINRTNVFNLDNTAPVITMNGSSPLTVYTGSTYTDAGATATDAHSGVSGVVTSTGTVNTSVAGTYTITYNVSDLAGNAAVPVTRTINVVDNIAPTVTFGTNGNTTWGKSRNTTVTVSDAHTGVNTSSLKYLWNTSVTQPSEVSFTTTFTNGGTITSPASVTGGYYLWVLAKDNAGNTTITRTNVFNLDNTVPVITMNGSTPVNIAINSTYTDAGATANDTSEGVITNRIVATSTVNTSVGGTYTVTYNVSDTAGNAAASVVRTVIVRYCASGTLVNDPTYGYICSTTASSSTSCNSCTYSVSNYGSNCSSCGSTCSITDTTSNIATTTYSCPSGYTSSGSGSSMTCSKTTTTSPSTTAGSAYCSEPTYSISGGSCVRTVSCSGCAGLGVDCMNAKCGAGGYTNGSWSCGTSTCTATMAIRYSCSTGTNDSMYSSTCYYCPSGYTTSGTGSSTSCSKVTTTSNIATTSYSCPSGYTSSGSGSSMTCSKTTTTTSSSTCPGGYTTVSCNSCTYYTSTYGANCSSCGSTTSYYCSTGWSNYTGSGSSLTCYKGAN